MQDNNGGSFMDRKTLIAIGLMAVVLFGWQSFLAKKYPDQNKTATSTTVPTNTADEAAKATTTTPNANVTANDTTSTDAKPRVDQPESLLHYEDEEVSFDLSSQGMGLKNYILKKHTNRKNEQIAMGLKDEGLFVTSVLGATTLPHFELKKVNDTTFEGRALVEGTEILKTIEILANKMAFKIGTNVVKPSTGFRGLEMRISEATMVPESSSFLFPSFDHQELIVKHTSTTDRINVTGSKEVTQKEFPGATLSGVSSQYFAAAIVDESPIIPEAVVRGGVHEKIMTSRLQYKPTTGGQDFALKATAFAGPKSYDHLKRVDAALTDLINFGFFSMIAKWLLVLLQWFHTVIPNWGVAIILLTVLVRLLVLPFNVTSYRSMKRMQTIQPKIQSLRERYKDNPQALNQEMMKMMRDEKVNPIGGCLPMLLQMPVFFALYQVLGQSIELYQAPFFGWIHDLSLKDPFYVLPALMALSMFIQQKITPTTMDPAQAKIMQWIPMVFALMMISLPSGLTLYIFVSTLFGILQQQLFMKERGKA